MQINLILPGLGRGVQDLDSVVHVKLCTDYLVHSCAHRLYLEALEGKIVQHPLSSACMQLHKSQRVARAELPKTGHILLKLLCCDGQLLRCELLASIAKVLLAFLLPEKFEPICIEGGNRVRASLRGICASVLALRIVSDRWVIITKSLNNHLSDWALHDLSIWLLLLHMHR